MERHHAPVCSIVPPYILRHIASNGSDEERALAHTTLELSAQLRGRRDALSIMPALMSVPAGEKRRTVYDARHGHALPGKLVRGEGSPSTKDRSVNEAYDGAGTTYDFYEKVLGRNSIDGRGLRLDSSVHYGVKFNNAQWDGRQMIYGDGDGRIFGRFTGALDVIAHELTHGVTQYSAALSYHDQSGALNEHMSDVFGILVKQYSLKQTAAKSDWIIGRGIFTSAVHGDGVRSMKAPGTAYDDKLIGRDPQPAHMKHYVKGADDNGGVHVNSGIPNHAFYQVATLLGGKAWEVAGKIWYLALTKKLSANAQFAGAARATHAAATELYGANSAPAEAVLAGWRAVGIVVEGVIEKPPGKARLSLRDGGGEDGDAVRSEGLASQRVPPPPKRSQVV